MKNRKLAALIILVIFIWGTIGYKIYSGLQRKDNPLRAVRSHQPENAKAATYHLSLSYPDPFFKRVDLAEKPVKRVTVKKIDVPVSSPVMVDWSKIQYMGLLYNASTKTHMAIVTIAGREYFIKQGEVVQEFLINEVDKDSIKVIFYNQSKYIKRSSPQ
jgi:hypothetical protein